jgi:hypothetical protein
MIYTINYKESTLKNIITIASKNQSPNSPGYANSMSSPNYG